MRTSILMSGFVIAETISPMHNFPVVLGVSIAVIFAFGFLADVIDLMVKIK